MFQLIPNIILLSTFFYLKIDVFTFYNCLIILNYFSLNIFKINLKYTYTHLIYSYFYHTGHYYIYRDNILQLTPFFI